MLWAAGFRLGLAYTVFCAFQPLQRLHAHAPFGHWFIALVFAVVSCGLVWFPKAGLSQEPAEDTAPAQVVPDTLARDSLPPRKKVQFLPLPVLDFGPETSLLFGLSNITNLNLFEEARTSNARLEGSYTLNEQWLFDFEVNLFTNQEGWFIRHFSTYRIFPEQFWGMGGNTPNSNQESYFARRFELEQIILRNLWPEQKLFFGPRYFLQWVGDVQPAEGGILESQPVTGKQGGISSGIGYQVVWDQRSNILNPKTGHYLLFGQQFYEPFLGSDFRFAANELDVRKYWQLFGTQEVILAAQFRSLLHTGTPPFRLTALFGSSEDMRGYYRGRYRARQYYSTQAELRFPLFWRIGGVVFGGGGDIADQWGHFRLPEIKPTYGAGIRFKIDRANDVNIQADIAFGERGSSGIYFGFGEAF